MKLPIIENWNQWEEIYTDKTIWEPAIRKICHLEGIEFNHLEKGFPGTHAVFLLDHQYVIKIYCPFAASDYEVESALYHSLEGIEDIPSPRQYVTGVLKDKADWPYVIIEYKSGEALRDIRNEISKENLLKVAGKLGEIIQSFHGVPLHKPGCFDPPEWHNFVEKRKQQCIKDFEEKKLFANSVLAEIKDFVESSTPADHQPVLIHADLTADHLLLKQINGEWIINALIDVADAKAGVPEYEWVALWFDLFKQDHDCMEAFLKTYNPDLTFDNRFREKALFYTLLHQFSANLLETTMNRMGNPQIYSLEQLRILLFGGK